MQKLSEKVKNEIDLGIFNLKKKDADWLLSNIQKLEFEIDRYE